MRKRYGVVAALSALLVATGATPAAASGTANEVVFSYDADGDGVYGLYLRDLESKAVTAVLAADRENPVQYDDPELAPDGTRVAVSSNLADSPGQPPAAAVGIVVVARDGTGIRRLTTPEQPAVGETVDIAPAWSPDGRTVLFTRLTVTDPAHVESALLTVPAAGGAATPVPGTAGGYTADFDPTGGRIVFAARSTTSGGTGRLTVAGLDGTGARSLGVDGALPAWSPDGTTIAYSKVAEPGVAVLATVPAAGGAESVLSATRPDAQRTVAQYPSWTPDSEALVFDLFGYDDAGRPTAGDVWAVDRAGVRADRVVTSAGDDTQPSVQGPAPAPVVPAASSAFTAVLPRRVLDTRDGTGAPAGKVGPGGAVTLAMRGVATARGPVPANATAVVLNVTVTGGTASTDVRVYPSGTALPLASNVNAPAGSTVPNLVVATLGTDGAVVLRNGAGSVHLLADLAGWFTSDAFSSTAAGAPAGFTAVDPRRILDTRSGVGAAAARVGAAATLDLAVTGTLPTADGDRITVPANASAVVLNVTAVGASQTTDVRVYPTPRDDGVPVVSNLNLRAGQTTPNLVTVAVGDRGRVRLRNSAGGVHLLADIAGYYVPGSGARYVPVAPLRFLDTRSGVGAAPILVPGGAFVDLRVAGTRRVPGTAAAAVLNLTGTGVSSATDVRGYPSTAQAIPTVSNLNLVAGSTRANLSVARPGTTGRVRLRNASGTVHLVADLAGYYLPS